MTPLAIIAITAVNILLSIVVGYAGRKRKFGFWGYFFASIAFTPLLGILFVLASDARTDPPLK